MIGVMVCLCKTKTMALKTITKKVLSYSEIPENIEKPFWIEHSSAKSFVECHLDDTSDSDLSKWIIENYPELKDEESFFIEIDY